MFNNVLIQLYVTNHRLLMLDIAIWLIVALLGAIVYIVCTDFRSPGLNTRPHDCAVSLGDTHKLGYEGLTMAVQRLEQRVRQLEERR